MSGFVSLWENERLGHELVVGPDVVYLGGDAMLEDGALTWDTVEEAITDLRAVVEQLERRLGETT